MDNMENTEEIRSIVEGLKEKAVEKKEDTKTVSNNAVDSSPEDIKKMLMKQFGIKKAELEENSVEKDDYSVDTDGFSENVEDEVPTDIEELPENVENEVPTDIEELPENVESENPTDIEELSENVENEVTLENEELPESVESEVPVKNEELSENVESEVPVENEELSENVENKVPTDIEELSENVENEVPVENEEFDSLKQYPQITVADVEKQETDTVDSDMGEEQSKNASAPKLSVDELFSNLKDVEIEEVPKIEVKEEEPTSDTDVKISEEIPTQELNEDSIDESENTILDLEDDPTEIYNTIKLYAGKSEISEKDGNNSAKPKAVNDSFDDTDIKLLVSLGEENELTRTLGLERVQKALKASKEINDKVLKEREVYGCNGEEYSVPEDEGRIKRRYSSEKRISFVKILITAVLSFSLFVFEMISGNGIGIGTQSEKSTAGIIIGLVLLTFIAGLSFNNISRSFRSLLNFSTVSSFTAYGLYFVNVINDFALIFSKGGMYSVTYHTPASLLFFYVSLCEYFAVKQQKSAFDIASSDNLKYALEEKNAKETEGSGDDDDGKYSVEKTDFVGNYFERTSRPTNQSLRQLVLLIISLAVSIFTMVLFLILDIEKDMIFGGFILTSTMTVGVISLFCLDFGFLFANKKLNKKNTTFIGFTTLDEYRYLNKILIDDVDVFEKNGVRTKGLKVYDNSEIYKVLYNASAVFSAVGGPLKAVFEYATSEMKKSENVRVTAITKNGISAMVDGKTAVLIGNVLYMKQHNIPYRYSDNDKTAEDTAEGSVTYISLDGNMSAKLYASYRISKKFDDILRKLNDSGVDVVIRSSDPSLNDKWASIVSDFKKVNLTVERPDIEEIRHSYRVSDSSVISSGNSLGIADAVLVLKKLLSLDKIVKTFSTIGIIAGTVISVLLFNLTKGSFVCLYVSFALMIITVISDLILSYALINKNRK